jgi:5-methylcytosine-specific restriction endonuclease McrA
MSECTSAIIYGDITVLWLSGLFSHIDAWDRQDYIAIPVVCLDNLINKDIDYTEFIATVLRWANKNNDELEEEKYYEEQYAKRLYDSWHERCNSNACDYVCAYCGKDIEEFGHLDHIIPKSRGGKDGFHNIVSSCPSCNAKKGARTPEEADMPIKFGMLNLLRLNK